MTVAAKLLTWVLRLAFLAALFLGVALWSGHGYSYLRLHMWIGFIATFALLLLVILGFVSRLRPALLFIALLWAMALPLIGIAQLRILPGSNHWVIQTIHLILGIGAIGLGEALSKRTLLRSSARA
ncbi:MAG: hypothetical protein JO210_10365 [Acidobacteriaceae bacterium]|nr:hypothetical protein [Acidobacteriaceae bacterium]